MLKINKNPLCPRKYALTCTCCLSFFLSLVLFEHYHFFFSFPTPLCNLSTAFIFFYGQHFKVFFPALFCHKKIGSHTITAKRVCRDPLASCFTLFLLKPWFREGKGLSRSDLSFTSRINCHLLCEASPDAIGVIGTLFERIHQIYHSVVKHSIVVVYLFVS